MQENAAKVLIIDDHQLFADGLELLLSQLAEPESISTYSDAEFVLENEHLWLGAELIIIDLHMPNISGFAFLQAMQEHTRRPAIAVISGVESRSEIEHALALGADAFIPKDSPSSQMLEGIKRVLDGERYLPPQWVGKIDWPRNQGESHHRNSLTEIGPRQVQVLRLLEEGLQNKQIALVLGVSVSTVKSHTQLLYRSLNVTNRTACIKAANDQGLL